MPDYPTPVLPKVPHENEPVMAPQLVMEGLRAGLGAAVQMSQQRRQTESDMARMALLEQQQQDTHDFNQKKLDIDAKQLESTSKLNDAHAQYYLTAGTNRQNAAERDLRWNQQEESLVKDVNEQADLLRLTDARFATDDPVGFGAAAVAFRDMYGHSDKPWLKQTIAEYMRKADQQKISIRRAARNANGVWKAGDAIIQVPIWQVAQKLKNPNTYEEAMKELEFGGHIGQTSKMVETPVTKGWKKFVNDWTPGNFYKDTKEEFTDLTTSQAKQLQEKAKATDFSRRKSRVPTATLPATRWRGTDPTSMPAIEGQERTEKPEPEEPQEYDEQASADGGYSETDTDTLLNQARMALQMGAAPNLVAARLQENGVDPDSLLGEGDQMMA